MFVLQIHGSYDSQLTQLHEMFDSIIVHLLSDSVSTCIIHVHVYTRTYTYTIIVIV